MCYSDIHDEQDPGHYHSDPAGSLQHVRSERCRRRRLLRGIAAGIQLRIQLWIAFLVQWLLLPLLFVLLVRTVHQPLLRMVQTPLSSLRICPSALLR